MAVLQIAAITIQAADLADVQAALAQRYASNGIPNPTTAQVLEAMRQEIISNIKTVTKQYRTTLAAVAEPGAT